MYKYRIKFTNSSVFIVFASSRKEAIKSGVATTRGLLTEEQQKENLQHCRKLKQ